MDKALGAVLKHALKNKKNLKRTVFLSERIGSVVAKGKIFAYLL